MLFIIILTSPKSQITILVTSDTEIYLKCWPLLTILIYFQNRYYFGKNIPIKFKFC